jgi:SAM-dependent MidA family methyltransferase
MSSEAPPQGNQRLIGEIRRAIERAGGRISFRDYMELALYHPELGYYCAAGEKTGRGGDYVTAPQLTPLFGACIARFIHSGPVLEIGAGDGSLAAQLCELFDYTILERSPDFRRRQQALLGGKVRWVDEVPAGFSGTVISNELLDALPVHRLVRDQERFVSLAASECKAPSSPPGGESAAQFCEVLGPYSTPRLAEYFARLGLRPAGEAEVNLDALDLMATVYERLRSGRVLTIDYGYQAEELFIDHPQGTFLTYRRQTADDEPYEHVGEKDMTSHVDFTSLMIVGESYGLRTVAFTNQADFLAKLGIGELLLQAQREAADAGAYAEQRKAVMTLLNPSGMGAYRVLIQEK